MPKAGIIIDAGPLIAFLVKEEKHHEWVVEQFQQLSAPFLTCDAVLTEVFFLLRKLPHGTTKFFTLLNSGLIVSDISILDDAAALEKLVNRYANVPMSLTDACLVRLSKLNPNAIVFTLDGDFQIYRRDGRQPIPLLMPPTLGK